MEIEPIVELENKFYKIQVKELELDGRYLFIKGIVLDADKDEAFELEDSIDLSEWNDNDTKEPGQETSNEEETQNES